MTSANASASGKLSSNNDVEHRAPKRQKIQVACAVCKSRKSKCDGARPVCGPCSRRRGGRDAHMCNYRLEGVNDVLVQQLSPANLANKNASTLPPNSYPTAGSVSLQASRRYVYANGNEALSEAPKVSNPRPEISSSDLARGQSQTPSDGSASDRNVDSMGCIDSWALRSGLLGRTSGVSFASQLRALADGTENPDRGTKGSRSDHVTTKLLQLRRKRDTRKDSLEQQLVLPTRRMADHLFEIYWTYSDVIFPWLDEHETRKHYQSLWTADDTQDIDEKVFYCTLNFIFAIAAKLDPSTRPELRHKLANTFYERARDLMSFDLLDISHFHILQTLLLATQYLQSTNMPRQCFQVLGLAVWVAQDLGLHLPETTCLLKDPRERELARRVWHGCICMDKIAAMVFGRPARISKKVADQAVYPRRSDRLADQSTTTILPLEIPAKLDFFIAYCKLHHILGDVLQITCSEDDECDSDGPSERTIFTTDRLNRLFEIDNLLLSWQESLPLHLKVHVDVIDSVETRQTTRQANILNARYQYVRLLLFRPFFTQACRSYKSSTTGVSSLESEATAVVVTQCQFRCVQAAQNIIELIACNLPALQDPQKDVLPSWWYTISYIFTSSLVIIAASLFPSIIDLVSATTLEDALDKGYRVLRHYHPYAGFARKCSSVVRSVHNKVNTTKQRDQPTLLRPSKHAGASSNPAAENLIDIHDEDSNLSCLDFDSIPEDFSWLEINSFDWIDEPWLVPPSDLSTNEEWQPGN